MGIKIKESDSKYFPSSWLVEFEALSYPLPYFYYTIVIKKKPKRIIHS